MNISYLISKIDYFESFESGWDGYDGVPISKIVIAQVKRDILILESFFKQVNRDDITPFIAPMSSGKIQIEFNVNKKYLEIEFHEGNKYEVLIAEYDTDTIKEFRYSDFNDILKHIKWLVEK